MDENITRENEALEQAERMSLMYERDSRRYSRSLDRAEEDGQ